METRQETYSRLAQDIIDTLDQSDISYSLQEIRPRVWNVQLTNSLTGYTYTAPAVTIGELAENSYDHALVACVSWLYPINEPEGWDTSFEADHAQDTAQLHQWLDTLPSNLVRENMIELFQYIDEEEGK